MTGETLDYAIYQAHATMDRRELMRRDIPEWFK